MASIRVQTAQNVSLEYEVASLGDRIVAAILDNLILGAWVAALAVLFAMGKLNSTASMVTLGVLAGVPYVFYHLACEVFFNGQSIGKKARDIRVMRLDGTAPSLGDYLLRWLLRIVDTGLMGGLVAIITIAANGRGQRLGDLAAGTTVVKVRPQASSALAPTLSSVAGYQPVFPQAALLADHDVALIRQLANQASARNNYELLNELANKVKEITGIQTDLQDVPFLQTVLRDHAHLAHQ
ncbi:RDD family protein [Hymenobacter armeniacus]|uniref:RDD family protein n=1 Tax=Hymenobacter armeniacus TaxID=2771358 RepID=A0ABR8K184_9BACT|nr:RDD family protein [Hymenobacter armeniacus]MBD2724074.1 RDD family protein [Hymenobacter armeniacus]